VAKRHVPTLEELIQMLADYTVVFVQLDLFENLDLQEVAGVTKTALLEQLPAPLREVPPQNAIAYLKHCSDPGPAGFMFDLQSLAKYFGKLLTPE
jgi:hypothetical protein